MKRIRLEWDGVCVCGKRAADGVRCKFGATHEPLKPHDDSDETEGRKLYRAKADAFASAQVNMGRRRVSIKRERLDLFDDE